jgi:hypothetical protein
MTTSSLSIKLTRLFTLDIGAHGILLTCGRLGLDAGCDMRRMAGEPWLWASPHNGCIEGRLWIVPFCASWRRTI